MLSTMSLGSILLLLIVVAFVIGMAIQIAGFLCMVHFYTRRPPQLKQRSQYPPVSIIKPCLGAEDNEIENFDAFFNQDYPGHIELLFSVSTLDDKAIPVIEHYIKKYPQADAKLVLSTTRAACHLKVDALYDAQRQAKGEIIIWSDADTIVGPSYVSQMVSSLIDDGLSLVTSPQVDSRMNTFASNFKGVSNNIDLATYCCLGMYLPGDKRFAWGHSLGFKREDFDGVGDFAWYVLNRYIVDDQALPYIFQAAGKKYGFRNIFCPVQWSNKTFSQVFRQKRYWALFQLAAVGNRGMYFSGVFLTPHFMALLLMLATGFAPWSVVSFLCCFFFRGMVGIVHEKLALGKIQHSPRYFWMVPLWDLLQVYSILISFWQTRIKHCGKYYRIGKKFFLTPDTAPSAKTQAEPFPISPALN